MSPVSVHHLINMLSHCTFMFYFESTAYSSETFWSIFQTSICLGQKHYIMLPNKSGSLPQYYNFKLEPSQAKFSASCEVGLFDGKFVRDAVFMKSFGNFPAYKYKTYKFVIPILKIYVMKTLDCLRPSSYPLTYCVSTDHPARHDHHNYEPLQFPILLIDFHMYIASAVRRSSHLYTTQLLSYPVNLIKFKTWMELKSHFLEAFSQEKRKQRYQLLQNQCKQDGVQNAANV